MLFFTYCLSDVCLSVAIGPNSRTERPRKTKIRTRDSDTTLNVKGQLVADVLNSQHVGTGATWRINTKILSTCSGGGISWPPPAQLVSGSKAHTETCISALTYKHTHTTGHACQNENNFANLQAVGF